MDHVGSSKIKVKGFLKKAFIWLDRKEASTFIDGAPLKKVTQNRERERETDKEENRDSQKKGRIKKWST